MGDLILFRGLPGAGKSSIAALLVNHLFCADDYFYDRDGEYRFDPDLLPQAHAECQEGVRRALQEGKTPVAVANTLSTEAEIIVYANMAQEFGYRFFSLIVENRHGNSSTHSVPAETIQVMLERFTVNL